MNLIKVGQIVLYEGQHYIIVGIRTRNDSEAVQGSNLMGNVVILESVSNKNYKIKVYDFDL
jgi:hypothetical protein